MRETTVGPVRPERAAALTGTIGAGAGVVLAILVVGLGIARRAKPFHPRGRVVTGVLEVVSTVPELGVVGRAGRHEVLLRFSDGVGLPGELPDVRGLAVRLPGEYDLLLASGGAGPLARYVPLPRRPRRTVMTTLMPFRSPVGPVVLAAHPTPDPLGWRLSWARGSGAWRDFAVLTCAEDPAHAPDRPVRFDPVLHGPAGLPPYRWAAGLRRFAYRWSRRYVPTV